MESTNQIVANKSKRGGARPGAGRPTGSTGDLPAIVRKVQRDASWQAIRAASPLLAHEILSHVVDERKTWARLLSSPDDRIVLQAMMFLVSMRDGRPAQAINVTSQSINVNVTDVDKARAIVRELITPVVLTPELTAPADPNLGQTAQVVTAELTRTESESSSIMLSGDDGPE